MKERKIVNHELKPIYDENSQVLILGTLPSVKSRELQFYYAHPKNRFWGVLEEVFQEKIEDKEEFLHTHHIALWDVIQKCEISASSDASIKNVIPNDLEKIISKSPIKVIFTTGKTAHKYYQKYFGQKITLPEINLPSSSPANCKVPREELIRAYQQIKEQLEE